MRGCGLQDVIYYKHLEKKQPITTFLSLLDGRPAKRKKSEEDIISYTRKQPQQPEAYTSNAGLKMQFTNLTS